MFALDVELGLEGLRSDNAVLVSQIDYAMLRLGSKAHPYTEDGWQYHLDGVAAELAPTSPYNTAVQAIAELYRKIDAYRNMVPGGFFYSDYMELSESPLMGEVAPFVAANANMFGCSPDYQNGLVRVVPDWVRDSALREIGFHWHLDLHPKFCDTRSENDIEMGVPPTNAEAQGQIAQELRRVLQPFAGPPHPTLTQWYRQPGVYRPKRYGIEYRSLGASVLRDPGMAMTMAVVLDEWTADHFRTHSKRTFA